MLTSAALMLGPGCIADMPPKPGQQTHFRQADPQRKSREREERT